MWFTRDKNCMLLELKAKPSKIRQAWAARARAIPLETRWRMMTKMIKTTARFKTPMTTTRNHSKRMCALMRPIPSSRWALAKRGPQKSDRTVTNKKMRMKWGSVWKALQSSKSRKVQRPWSLNSLWTGRWRISLKPFRGSWMRTIRMTHWIRTALNRLLRLSIRRHQKSRIWILMAPLLLQESEKLSRKKTQMLRTLSWVSSSPLS